MENNTRFYLTKIFGTSVHIKIIEILLKNSLTEHTQSKILWYNFSEIAFQANVSKSSGKRILENLLKTKIIEERKFETHAQNPPRMVRLNTSNPAVNELIFLKGVTFPTSNELA